MTSQRSPVKLNSPKPPIVSGGAADAVTANSHHPCRSPKPIDPRSRRRCPTGQPVGTDAVPPRATESTLHIPTGAAGRHRPRLQLFELGGGFCSGKSTQGLGSGDLHTDCNQPLHRVNFRYMVWVLRTAPDCGYTRGRGSVWKDGAWRLTVVATPYARRGR